MTAAAIHVRDVEPSVLLTQHAGLVKRSASRLRSRLPASVQTEDLIQAGMIVLLEAAARYDETQGASFETYAAIRVRGAMLDEVRNSEWAPRSVQRKARQLSQAMDAVTDRTEREARDTEVAEHLGMSVTSLRALFREASARRVVSLEEMATQEEVLIAVRYREETKNSPFTDVRHGGASLLDAAKQRLALWDVPERDIQRLIETGETRKTLTLYAPSRGAVTHLMVREGMEVTPNANL